MRISNHSYTTLIGNPEYFRWSYLQGVMPMRKDVKVQRGSMLHLLIEQYFTGMTDERLRERMIEDAVTPEGEEMGRLLWPTALEEILSGPKVIAVEIEFEVPLEGIMGTHYLTGRLENIIEAEPHAIREYKTTRAGRRRDDIKREHRASPQIDISLIGAHHLGYSAQYVDILTFVEGTPPIPIETREERDNHALEYTKRSITMTCDMAEFWIKHYGIDRPWPHWISSRWWSDIGRCNAERDKDGKFWCEYKDFCGQTLSELPEGFRLDKCSDCGALRRDHWEKQLDHPFARQKK